MDLTEELGAVVWTRVEGVNAHRLGEELLVVDGQGEMLRGLNASGRRVWELIDGRRSASELAATLASEFRISPDQVFPEMVAFLADLEKRGLLVRAPSPEGV